jgi:hypothetical protein
MCRYSVSLVEGRKRILFNFTGNRITTPRRVGERVMNKLVSDIVVVIVLAFPIWFLAIMVLLQNAKGAIIEKRGRWRIKEGEKELCRGTKFCVVEKQYRKQRQILGTWWTIKWIKINNYRWMKEHGFDVI